MRARQKLPIPDATPHVLTPRVAASWVTTAHPRGHVGYMIPTRSGPCVSCIDAASRPQAQVMAPQGHRLAPSKETTLTSPLDGNC
jgi:hypothetical protein